jgi:hypothetical protein
MLGRLLDLDFWRPAKDKPTFDETWKKGYKRFLL